MKILKLDESCISNKVVNTGMGFRSLLLVLLIAGAHAAPGQYPRGVTMHRVQAGEIDSSGWATARSTDGGFTVRLPIRFNDFTFEDPNPNSLTAKTFTVGGTSAEGLKFSAVRVTYRKADTASARFAKIKRGEGFSTKPQSVKSLTVSGRKAVDIEVGDNSNGLHQRVVMVEQDLITLMIEAPAAHRALAARFKPTFFESLVIEQR